MSTIDNGKLEISFNSIGLSKGIGCNMKLQSNKLRGKEINIGKQNQTSSTSTEQPLLKKGMGKIIDNGSELTYKIFWKKDLNSSESFPLPFCCEDCGLESIEFRCLSAKFSWDGKCEVPITLWCSPTHNRRPKATVLILEIEITHNDMNVKGVTHIPFKKHTKSQIRVESVQKNPMKFQQQISILSNTVQSINRLVESLPEDKATELESLRCYASLLLIEAEKKNPQKRKMLEEGEEETEQQQPHQQLYQLYQQQQQPQPYQFYQPQQPYKQEIVNTVTTSNPTFTTNPFEIPNSTTNTNTLPTQMTYTPSTTNTTIDTTPLPFTFKVDPDCPFISRVPPEIFKLFFGSD